MPYPFSTGLNCGGAYFKLLAVDGGIQQPADLTPDTPYTIMFGPDVCGDTNKVHLILKKRNPVTGEDVEHHLAHAPIPASVTDRMSHLYRFTITPEGDYQVAVDDEIVQSGNVMGSDFEPPLQPAEMIDDATDSKPADWIDDPEMDDPADSKPADWPDNEPPTIVDPDAQMPEGWLVDAPAMVPDPDAEEPEEWDEEEDGEWMAPQVENPECVHAPGCGPWHAPKIPNPAYKGVWKPRRVPNPEYKGEWAPRRIPNPRYYESAGISELSSIAGVALEIWTMQAGISFDNVVLTNANDKAVHVLAAAWRAKSSNQQAATANAAASARAAARAEAWAEGGFSAWLQLALGDFTQWVADNLMVAVLTVLAGVLGATWVCMKSCCAEEKLDDEWRAAFEAQRKQGLTEEDMDRAAFERVANIAKQNKSEATPLVQSAGSDSDSVHSERSTSRAASPARAAAAGKGPRARNPGGNGDDDSE